MTGRGKGVLRAFKCSRIALRELISKKEKLSESQNPVGNVLSQNF